MTEYKCFYPSTPLWVGDRPDFSIFRRGGISLSEFLSKREASDETDDYSLCFCKDGLCMVHIKSLHTTIDEAREETRSAHKPGKRRVALERWQSATKTYIDYLNVLQLLLDIEIARDERGLLMNAAALRNSDVFPVLVDDSRMRTDIDYSGVRSFHATRDVLRKGRDLWNYNSRSPLEEDSRIALRRPTPLELFQRVISTFQEVTEDLDRVRILSQSLIAVDNYNVGNHEAALVQTWFIIELFINLNWVRFLATKIEDGSERINSKRREWLTGRDFTAAIISNVLELVECIDFATLSKIDVVRKARNAASHKLDEVRRLVDQHLKVNSFAKQAKGVSAEDCRIAFELVSQFIEQEYGIELRLHEKLLF